MKLKFLVALLLLFVPCVCPSQEHVYMISVGISNYPDKENRLKLPAKDAATMEWLYKRNGKLADSKLLTDNQATKTAIVDDATSIFAKADENDEVVFFFSGHGFKGSLCTYDGYLNYRFIRDLMSKCRAKYKVIYIDACFAGEMTKKKTDVPDASETDSLTEHSEVLLFLSSRASEKSIEMAQVMRNAVFTAALQRGLRGGADIDKNKTITAKELFNYVSSNVKRLTNNMQHPVMWGKFDGEMPLMTW